MGDSASYNVLSKIRREGVLSVARPRRAEVLELEVDEPVGFAGSLAIWRNHSIEPMLALLDVFLRHSGVNLEPVLGAYDDGLSFAPDDGAQAELVWFDLDRVSLSGSELLDWFAGRIEHVVHRATGPVVVVPVSSSSELTATVVERLQRLAGARCADPWPLCDEAGLSLIDERTEALTGSRVGREAQLQLARAIGMRWLPAVLLPPRKLVAVDLDETLHHGVLGEDGTSGVVVSPAHRRLHDYLKELATSGTMLALISRNESEDIIRLFSERSSDYGLGLDDFVAVEVSWESKADSIRRVTEAVRIGEEAVVFVDDNAGELLTVGTHCPSVALVHASDDADRTVEALRWQAGLWRWSVDDSATLRVADLRANADREHLKEQIGDLDRYLAELGVHAKIGINRFEQLGRLADISQKTNQFNLNLLRLSEVDLRRSMSQPNDFVTSIALSDRLSDSGIIALLVTRCDMHRLLVHELAMSCRAMGRGLESVLVSQALRSLPCWGQVEEVWFEVKETERNLPARRWLAEIASGMATAIPEGRVVVANDVFNAIALPEPVSISIVGPTTDAD